MQLFVCFMKSVANVNKFSCLLGKYFVEASIFSAFIKLFSSESCPALLFRVKFNA